jgi:hypothetical protein
MGDIFVILPKYKEKAETTDMMFAKTEMEGKQLKIEQVEQSLKSLIAMFETIEATKYFVDEAKLSIGVVTDESGNVKAGLSTNFWTLFKGEISAEVAEKLSGNNLVEITIKRKTD